MQRWGSRHCVVAVLFLLSGAASSPAYITVPKEPIPNKVALADCVVLGKITAVQPKPVRARLYPQSNAQTEFVIADLEVFENFLGPGEAKKVRLGFIGFQVKSGQYKPAPAVGQEGCFYAVKHSAEDFYVVPAGGFHDKKGKDFDKELALTRRCGTFLSQPDQGLKAKAAKDRVLAAYLLVLRYTYAPMRRGGRHQARPIDAEQSKLVLRALAEADWDLPPEEAEVSPQSAMGWLGAAASHSGSPLPRTFPVNRGDPKQYTAALKQWLRDNAESFRIQQLVPVTMSKE